MQRIVITIAADGRVEWSILVKRHGAWLETVYSGYAGSIDEAYVAARRHLPGEREA